MSLFVELQNLSFLISEFLAPFASAALINMEGQILGLKYESLPEIGTFSPLIQTVSQYFKPAPGDYIMTNDPYTGGTLLSVFSLVTCFEIQDQKFYFVARTRFKPRLAIAKKLDDEGVRVPPTPICSGGILNESLIEAISGHPLAPEELKERLIFVVAQMERQIAAIRSWSQKNPHTLSKISQKNLINETKNRLLRKLNDMARGETLQEILFETGELIRVHCEIKAQEVNFDFAGTSGSKRLFLTDMATFGTCLGALLSFLREELMINEGAFSIINVTTPQGCFLNAKYPAPFFEGAAEAATMIASTVFHGLSLITSSQSVGVNGSIPSIFSIQFSKELTYFDALPGGTGASAEAPGIDGYYLWNLGRLQTSVEEVERRYPLLVRQTGIRQGSGGKGKQAGGNGVLREIEILQDGTLKWLLGLRNTQTKGLKNAQPGQAAEMTVIKVSGEKIQLQEVRGEMSLQKGDKLISASSGGGGFGKLT